MRISARKCSKSAVKRLVFAFWEQEGVPNRKKVAKKSEFLFLQGADRPGGADPAKDTWRRSGVGFAKDAWSLVTARAQVAQKSEEPTGGNGADYAQDARYRGDGDEASFRERDKQLTLSSRHCLLFLAIQIRGLWILC